MSRLLAVVLLLAAASTFACSACSSADAPSETSTTFLAFSSDFQGYRSWPSYTLSSAEIANSPHTSGARTVYLKKPPPHGSTEFPIGTVIVKEFADQSKIFAMVKRGGDFNSTGAVGWEWFELLLSDTGAVVLKWRGVGPPLGEVYGGDANGGCNGCHGNARSNDFVQDGPLTLSNF